MLTFLVLNCTIKHSWVADITARVGVVALGREPWIYPKGGLAWQEANFNVGDTIKYDFFAVKWERGSGDAKRVNC